MRRFTKGAACVAAGSVILTLAVGGPAAATPQLGQLTLVAGLGSSAPSTTIQAGTAVSFDYPRLLAGDANDNVYVADSNHNQVQKITPGGDVVTVAGDGNQSGSANLAPSGPATQASFSAPEGVAVDSGGNLYIAAPSTYRVLKVDTAGQISVFAGTGYPVSGGGLATPGPATATAITGPTALAVDGAGDVYITDVNTGVYKVTPSGTLSVVTSGLALGTGLAVDAAGNVYVAYHSADVVDKVTPGGSVTTVAGSGVSGSALPASGPATSADLDGPLAVAVDAVGNLVISQDGSNNGVTAVYRVDTTGTLTVLAGTGNQGAPTLGVAATSSDLSEPAGIALDSTGQVLMADATDGAVYGLQVDVRPGAPSNLGVVPGDTTAALSFTAPTPNGGSLVVAYQVSTDGGTTWQNLTTSVNGVTVTGTVTGLTNGTTYAVAVRAVNAVGAGPASGPASATPVAPPPPPPAPAPSQSPSPSPSGGARPDRMAAPVAVAGRASVSVSWTASSFADVTGYTVSAHPGDATCTTIGTTCLLGAVAGTPTTYTVVAHAPGGDSESSPPSNAVTAAAPDVPPTPPGSDVPTTLTTTDGQLRSVDPGQPVVVLGTGFAAHSTASVVIYSVPRALATVTTDEQGDFRAPVTVPADLAPGGHTLFASGTDPQGHPHRLRLPVTVTRHLFRYAPPTAVVVTPGGDARGEGVRSAVVSFQPPVVQVDGRIRYQVSVDSGRRWRSLAVTPVAGTSRLRGTLTGLRPGGLYRVVVRVVVTRHGAGVTGRSSVMTGYRAERGWYHDPLLPAARAALVPVPRHPGRYNGPAAGTRAAHRSRNGSLVVPVAWLAGRRLSTGQGAELAGDGRFAFDSAVITPAGAQLVRTVARSLRNARAVTCEGYTDYAGSRRHEMDLSRRRARAVCAALTASGVRATTTFTAYGPDWPVQIGGSPRGRTANRRVIVFVTR